ncbi:hypothetical protein HYG77_04905 [Rhodococcus sp. ZPP]|uniref:hypothetical protein n=1 Tax=Rhodococcus sp. ZPP TaxID=2749906 RepID=UPI001AD89B4D|nr:hypothetical protein [Rhodococcus sp. ZPP]QTJ65003.1 hypothetical protein HYG77_04905 [Rhodococcus sp. ZPP]
MSGDRKLHVLVKKFDPELEGADIEFDYDLECPGQPHCNGWMECEKPHEFDGFDAANGPDDCIDGCGDDEDAPCDCENLPWSGLFEFEFHGVVHTWRHGYGWTVPYRGCVVLDNDGLETADEITIDQPPGRYLVNDDWQDEHHVYLELVGPEVK